MEKICKNCKHKGQNWVDVSDYYTHWNMDCTHKNEDDACPSFDPVQEDNKEAR